MKLDIPQKALLKVVQNLNYQKSIYVYGGVGTGKTMIMKKFYESCQMEKQYSHFHEFMRDFHIKMHSLRDSNYNKDGRLVEHITSRQPRVLCFDEFQVTDISDAMILYNILKNMWNQNKFVFFTGNRHPSELYKNGMQRDSFLPCIDLILEKCIVHRLDNKTDYRKLKALDRGFMIDTPENKIIFDKILTKLTNDALETKEITYMKRSITAKCHGRVAVFDFDELCDRNLGASDYLELTRHFDICIIKNIPQLSLKYKSQARRFITLIDALYEKHVSCVFLAANEPLALFNATAEHSHERSMLQDMEIDFDAYKSPLFTGEEELFAAVVVIDMVVTGFNIAVTLDVTMAGIPVDVCLDVVVLGAVVIFGIVVVIVIGNKLALYKAFCVQVLMLLKPGFPDRALFEMSQRIN